MWSTGDHNNHGYATDSHETTAAQNFKQTQRGSSGNTAALFSCPTSINDRSSKLGLWRKLDMNSGTSLEAPMLP